MTDEIKSDEIKPINTWCVLEMMGHAKTAGQVSEETHFGTVLLRIDVPAINNRPEHTEFYGGSAIYRITPCDETTARLVLTQTCTPPIMAYQLPRPEFKQMELPGEEGEGEDEP